MALIPAKCARNAISRADAFRRGRSIVAPSPIPIAYDWAMCAGRRIMRRKLGWHRSPKQNDHHHTADKHTLTSDIEPPRPRLTAAKTAVASLSLQSPTMTCAMERGRGRVWIRDESHRKRKKRAGRGSTSYRVCLLPARGACQNAMPKRGSVNVRSTSGQMRSAALFSLTWSIVEACPPEDAQKILLCRCRFQAP